MKQTITTNKAAKVNTPAPKINLVAIAKSATAQANKVKRTEEYGVIATAKTTLSNTLTTYRGDVLSLNKRCAYLIDNGKCGAVKTKSELIGIIKKHYPYVLDGGKFAKYSVVYRENGAKYLQFSEVENISDSAIVNAYVAYLNSQSMSFRDKVKPQMQVLEFMSVDKKPLESVEFDVLMAEKVANKIYSYNPTPEAMAAVAKEKADKAAKAYADALEVKAGAGKVVYVAE